MPTRGGATLYRLVAAPGPPPEAGRPGEARPDNDGRVSGTLDLAAVFRLSAGDDLTLQSCGVSSRSDRNDCNRSQAAAAAIEKREEVAEMAARSPSAQVGLYRWSLHLAPVASLEGTDKLARWLDRFPLCLKKWRREDVIRSASTNTRLSRREAK